MNQDLKNLFIVSLAREMRNEDRVFIGSNQLDVAKAAVLARRLWAPDLKYWSSASAALNRAPDNFRLGRRSYDNYLVEGRDAFFWQARAFDEMGLRPPVCFAGGIQIDSRGNANLSGIYENNRWKLRGPGSAGLPSLTAWPDRFYIITPDHNPRILVEKCSRISVLGDPEKRRLYGMKADALAAIITPIARFELAKNGLVLTERLHGVSEKEIVNATGFDFQTSAPLRERPAISPQELTVLESLDKAVWKAPSA